jgi:hypothetical protein
MSRCRLQIRREPDLSTLGRLTVAIDNRTVFDLEVNETKVALCEPGDAMITVRNADGDGFSRRMVLPEDQLLILSLHEVKPMWWKTLLGISRSLDVTEISRTDLASDKTGPGAG